jgi:Tfp pilus assembly protein PilN
VINLLPPAQKEHYRYARLNHLLAYWLMAGALAIFGVVVITAGGFLSISGSINAYQTRIATVQSQLASDNLTGTERQITTISNNLKLLVNVLSKEILFSKLLARLGSLTPNNAILTNLSISQNQSAIDITAQTSNYTAATQLQINLADPTNQIFSHADLVSIACATGARATNPTYPCTAILRAQFTANNPFLFINSSRKAGA